MMWYNSVLEGGMSVQLALKRTQDAALERLTVAATEGDLDIVKNLLARGLPINQVSVCLTLQSDVWRWGAVLAKLSAMCAQSRYQET
jgi:hypothetical protein